MKNARFADKFWIVARLTEMQAGDFSNTSYYHQRHLEKLGYLTFGTEKKTEGRGRPQKTVALSGKGRSFLALSKNWKKKETINEAKPVEALEAVV